MVLADQTGFDGGGTPTHVDATAANGRATADRSANEINFRWTPSAGPSAAIAMWKVAASVVTLLAALFYGIGRLLVDGFYSNLNTSASAAGVNTISIIEPAAIFGALLALSVTAILMLSDIIQQWFNWMRRHSFTILALVAIAAVIGLIVWGIIYFKEFSLGHFVTLVGSALVVTFVRNIPFDEIATKIVERIMKVKEAKTGEKAGVKPREEAGVEDAAKIADTAEAQAKAGAQGGTTTGADAGAEASAQAAAETVAHLRKAISSPWPRVTAVGVISMIIIALCIGAHYLGVDEANQVKKGLPVNISVAGLDISSISATRVLLQPVDSSQAIKSLSARNCLLELGPGAGDFLIYDARNNETFSVPTIEVVAVDVTAPKQCVP